MKSFTSAEGRDPIPFKINGEVFHANPTVGAGIILRFAELTTTDPDDPDANTPAALQARGGQSLKAVREFFTAALDPDSLARFNGLLDARDRFVDMGLLLQIVDWLAQEYSSVPTSEPSASTSPAKRSGRASTAGRSHTATTYSRPDKTQLAPSA